MEGDSRLDELAVEAAGATGDTHDLTQRAEREARRIDKGYQLFLYYKFDLFNLC